jgi:hypothetical protein
VYTKHRLILQSLVTEFFLAEAEQDSGRPEEGTPHVAMWGYAFRGLTLSATALVTAASFCMLAGIGE